MIHEANTPIRAERRTLLDQMGIGIAGLCALHCVATIVLVSGLGLGGHFLLAPGIHRVGLALALIIAAAAIGWGVWRHRRAAPIVVALAGLGFMAGALLVPHGNVEFVLTIVGVSLVSLAHLINMRARSAQ